MAQTVLASRQSPNQNVQLRSESTSFSLSTTDEHKYIRYTGASGINVTVPDTLAVGSVVTIRQAGAGVVTLVAGSGVTLNGNLKTAGQHSNIQIIKISAGVYDVIGGVE